VFVAFASSLAVAAPAQAEPAASGAPTAPRPGAPPATEADTHNLQNPKDASTRYSAYSLPGGTWGIDVGALGIGGGDSFAKLGVGYGIGAGVEVGLNLAHAGVGLLNVTSRWHFVDTRYFDLGVRASFWYGHGDWFWILGDAAKKLVSGIDIVSIPVEITASTPIARFLQIDLGAGYRYAEIFGGVGNEDSIYVESQFGMRQAALRPGTRWFFWDNTALELHATLPFYSAVPRDGGEEKVPFSDTWSLETGLRSRFKPGVFGNIRLQYGEVAKAVYGARFYPAFELEFRL
jgi:hypothetical protein